MASLVLPAPPAALISSSATCAPLRMSTPVCASGPDSGVRNANVYVPPLPPPPPLPSSPPQAAAASTAADAAASRTRRPPARLLTAVIGVSFPRRHVVGRSVGRHRASAARSRPVRPAGAASHRHPAAA